MKSESKQSVSLRKIIEACATAYECDGAWDHLLMPDGTRNHESSGDTLVDFIVTEIAETYDPDCDFDDQIYEAERVMHTAERELHRVAYAIGRIKAVFHVR